MKQPLDRLASRKKATFRRVPVPMDDSIAAAYADAQAAHLQAQERVTRVDNSFNRQQLEDAEAALDEARADMETNLEWFHIRSIGPRAWDSLMSDHPPTPEQVKKARKDNMELAWNPDTFPAAALVTCVSLIDGYGTESEELVPLTDDFVKGELLDGSKWNNGEVMGLVQAAMEVNSMRRVVDMGNGSRRVRN